LKKFVKLVWQEESTDWSSGAQRLSIYWLERARLSVA